MDRLAYLTTGGAVDHLDLPRGGDAEAVAAMVREAVGTATGQSGTITTESAREALTVAAGSIGARWIIPASTQDVRPAAN